MDLRLKRHLLPGSRIHHLAHRRRPEFRFTFYQRPLYDLGTIRAVDHSLHFTLAIGYVRAK